MLIENRRELISIITIKDNSYYKSILGYIKINALCDEDYLEIKKEFENLDLCCSSNHDSTDSAWLYFMADLYMMQFYHSKYKDFDKATKENKNNLKNRIEDIKEKYISLYCKIFNQYKDFYDELLTSNYLEKYRVNDLSKEEDFLFDLMTLNQEFIYYDFITLNAIKSNTYEKLVFCYRNFIEGWSSKDILYKLRKDKLNRIFMNFINEYSKQSDLPQVAVLCYFYPLEEELYKSGLELSRLNRFFAEIDIWDFLKKTKAEKKSYLKSVLTKRINIIDKWCHRIREKIIDNTIDILSKAIYMR